MGNLIKSIVISTLGLFTIAFISTSCNKETVEQLKVKKASRIYIGDGTPLLDKGEAGDYYIDKLTGGREGNTPRAWRPRRLGVARLPSPATPPLRKTSLTAIAST